LRDIAHAGAARHVDAAVVGIYLADDRLHQRGLARAVAADQADARAGRQRGARAVEDRAPAQANRDIVDCQHRAPLAQDRACLDVFSVPPRCEWRKSADMDFQDLLVRYFGQADIDLVAPESLEAGLERIRVDFGLERDSGRRFGLWTLM